MAAAKAERNAASATAGFSALLRQRYFAGGCGGKGGKGSKASPYEGLQPGAISADLAQALGEQLALAWQALLWWFLSDKTVVYCMHPMWAAPSVQQVHMSTRCQQSSAGRCGVADLACYAR